MIGKVVHCKKEKYDVYIGRPSPWGNPFALKDESEREAVIKKYRAWLKHQIKTEKISKERVLGLRGKTLGCWCAPKACHGDVLLEEAEIIYQEKND
jgi:hypothetical protein